MFNYPLSTNNELVAVYKALQGSKNRWHERRPS